MNIARKIVLSALMLLVCLSVSAQSKRRRAERLETGSFLLMSAGAGISDLGYSFSGGQKTPLFAAKIAVEYAYFFTPKIGVGTGLSFSHFGSAAFLNRPLSFDGMVDYQGETFNHIIRFDHFRERQNMLLLEIPIAFHYKHKPYDKGYYLQAALKFGFPVSATYTVHDATVDNSVYYPLWNLEMHNLPDRFETVQLTQTDRIPDLFPLAAAAYFEAGGLWQMSRKVDLRVGGFVDFCMNNLFRLRNADRLPLGFAGIGNNADYMPDYDGILRTAQTGRMHPWAVGLKIGVSMYCGSTEREKMRKVRNFLKQYGEYIPRDTVLLHDTVLLRDTILLRQSDTLVVNNTRFDTVRVETIIRDTLALHDTIYLEQHLSRLDSLLSQSVIWFRFDDYTPILEPADIIDKIADMLRNHPQVGVYVNGHACDIGTEAYNLALALRRANAVADLLRQKGVRDEQMKVATFGASEPFKYNGPHQRAKDRRVEVIPFLK